MRVISRRARPPVSSSGASSPNSSTRWPPGGRNQLWQVADPGAKLIVRIGVHAGDSRAYFFHPLQKFSTHAFEYILSCPGVTNHTAPWKRSGSEDSTPECSLPAMGCPGRNLRWCLPKAAVARARISALVLPTSVNRVLGGRAGPRRPMSSTIAPTGAAKSTT